MDISGLTNQDQDKNQNQDKHVAELKSVILKLEGMILHVCAA